jgi:hypothetical protein
LSWYLYSGGSFYTTPHSVHLSSPHPSYRHLIVQVLMDPLFLLLDMTLFVLTIFIFLMFSVLDLTMQLMSGG